MPNSQVAAMHAKCHVANCMVQPCGLGCQQLGPNCYAYSATNSVCSHFALGRIMSYPTLFYMAQETITAKYPPEIYYTYNFQALFDYTENFVYIRLLLLILRVSKGLTKLQVNQIVRLNANLNQKLKEVIEQGKPSFQEQITNSVKNENIIFTPICLQI